MKKCGFCGFDNDDAARYCSDCEHGLDEAAKPAPLTPEQSQPGTFADQRTSRWTVAWLFFGTYFSPFLLWVGWGLLSYDPRTISKFNLMLSAWMILHFPNGLFGFASNGKDLGRLAVLGYAVYAVLFCVAFKARRHWQTFGLWIVLVFLLVFNAFGCRTVVERATRGMTLSRLG